MPHFGSPAAFRILAVAVSGQIVVSSHRTPEGGTATYRLIGLPPPPVLRARFPMSSSKSA